jgi:hypothetical protein
MRGGATISYRLPALQNGQFRCQSVDSGPIEKGILSQFPSRKLLLQSYSHRSLEIA